MDAFVVVKVSSTPSSPIVTDKKTVSVDTKTATLQNKAKILAEQYNNQINKLAQGDSVRREKLRQALIVKLTSLADGAQNITKKELYRAIIKNL